MQGHLKVDSWGALFAPHVSEALWWGGGNRAKTRAGSPGGCVPRTEAPPWTDPGEEGRPRPARSMDGGRSHW